MEQKFKCLSLFEFQERYKTAGDCPVYLAGLKWEIGFICRKFSHRHSCAGHARIHGNVPLVGMLDRQRPGRCSIK